MTLRGMELTNERSASGTMQLPLARVALCLDCETCFEIGGRACPVCGGRAWASVARFLDGQRHP